MKTLLVVCTIVGVLILSPRKSWMVLRGEK